MCSSTNGASIGDCENFIVSYVQVAINFWAGFAFAVGDVKNRSRWVCLGVPLKPIHVTGGRKIDYGSRQDAILALVGRCRKYIRYIFPGVGLLDFVVERILVANILGSRNPVPRRCLRHLASRPLAKPTTSAATFAAHSLQYTME